LRVYQEFGCAERWRAYEDVVPAFRRLRSRGLAIGLISNWDKRLTGLMNGMGIAPLLDTIVSSAEVGLHKPDPRIFELACERLGVSPHECAHVGDHHYADVLGARSVGMMPVLIDRHSGEGRPLAESAIGTLDDIETALGLEASR